MEDAIICKIGTRGSPLALAQAYEVRHRLCVAHGCRQDEIEIVKIKTEGDRNWSKPLAELGGKELFTKEIEEALIDGRIDCAVHSAKDMPSELPSGLALDIFLPREDVSDCLITRDGATLDELQEGAVLGTSSLRRAALIRNLRPDIRIVDIRGNVDTRMNKVLNGAMDATILAKAGLNRLGIETACALLQAPQFPPALGQGAICIERRLDDAKMHAFLSALNHQPTCVALGCERAFLNQLDGSCRTPMAGYAVLEDDKVHFAASVLSPDGKERINFASNAPIGETEKLGCEVARELLAQGAGELLARALVE